MIIKTLIILLNQNQLRKSQSNLYTIKSPLVNIKSKTRIPVL
jgi:hypothetical protein